MSRTTRIAWTAALATSVALVGLSGRVFPGQDPRPAAIDVQVAQTYVCPVIPSDRGHATIAGWSVTGDVSLTELTDPPARRALRPGSFELLDKPAAPLQADLAPGSQAGFSVTTTDATGLERGVSAAACEAPGTTAWFVGLQSTGTTSTDLLLTNVDAAIALVDVVAYGPSGQIVAAGSRSVEVRPGTTTRVAMSGLVSITEPYGVRVTTSQGRVSAVARTRVFAEGQTDGSGVDFVAPAVAPRQDLVVAAVPGGGGKRTLVITNPGERAAEVGVELLTPTGTKVVDAFNKVTVPPRATMAFPVETLLKGQPASIRLSATQPVTAGLTATTADSNGDVVTMTATRAFAGTVLMPVSLGSLTGQLQLANPGTSPAVVDVTALGTDAGQLLARRVTIDPGGATSVDLPPKVPAMVVQVAVQEGQVAGGVVLQGDAGGLAGAAVVPLRGNAQAQVVVDPVRDPGYGSES